MEDRVNDIRRSVELLQSDSIAAKIVGQSLLDGQRQMLNEFLEFRREIKADMNKIGVKIHTIELERTRWKAVAWTVSVLGVIASGMAAFADNIMKLLRVH